MRDLVDRRKVLQGGIMASVGAWFTAPPWAQGEERTAASARPVKITAVKTFLLKHQLKKPFGVSVSVPLDTSRSTLLVKLESDVGLVGWGETAPLGGVKSAIDDKLGPALIGQNPLAYKQLWRRLWGPNFGNPFAVGALDIALNDLRGKVLGLPIAELFGGRLRDRVPAYASAMNYLEGLEPEDYYPSEAVEKVKQGFQCLKMRLGRYSVRREAKIASAVRKAVGPDIRLMADGNGAYTMESAVAMGTVLHELGFEAFEEPLPQVAPHYTAYEELRRRLPLSLAAGEGLDSRASAKSLIDRRAMDIIQPDISLCGGIGEVLFISELAALSGIRCIPHCWASDILIAATVQALAVMSDPHWGLPTDTPMLELDQSENPWRDGLAKGGVGFQDGFVPVSTKPGLGIEIDEEMVDRYAVP